MEFLVPVVLIGAAAYVVYNMFRARKRRMGEAESTSKTAAATGLSVSRDVFGTDLGRAPLESFHVVGSEARVTFDVPLEDEDDEVLYDILTGEAIEVLREKRHSLPIDEVETIVVLAGRDRVREIARHKLPARGELPAPTVQPGISFTHIAHDPFAAHFDDDSMALPTYETSAPVPADELGPLRAELRLPKGLDRGLRALGTDPDKLGGPDFVIALLRMFGYAVTEHAYEGSYMAVKNGISTLIVTDVYQPGGHPELDESVIKRFLFEFTSSGADRGMLISDRYSPFMIYEIESNQPKVRFITRERVQRFIDSMAMG
jgi:hypothetical protein